jgi:hypothetical protein
MPQMPQLRRNGGQSTPRAGDSPRDRVGRVKGGGSNSAPHIAVISKAQVYTMELFHANGKSLSVEELQQQLESILELSARAERGETLAEAPIGLLTSLERDTWAHLRDKLIEAHPDNESALHAIESAMFVVVLEGRCPEAMDEQAKSLTLLLTLFLTLLLFPHFTTHFTSMEEQAKTLFLFGFYIFPRITRITYFTTQFNSQFTTQFSSQFTTQFTSQFTTTFTTQFTTHFTTPHFTPHFITHFPGRAGKDLVPGRRGKPLV